MEQIIDVKKTPKKKLLDLLQELPNTDNHFVLKDNGHFLGVVLSHENFEKYVMGRQAEAQKDLQSFLDAVPTRGAPNMSDEELNKEIVDAIHEMRGVK